MQVLVDVGHENLAGFVQMEFLRIMKLGIKVQKSRYLIQKDPKNQVSDPKKIKKMLILGKVGAGKSTIANVVINRNGNKFTKPAETGNRHGLTRVTRRYNVFLTSAYDKSGFKLEIIDTPGFDDEQNDDEVDDLLELLYELSSGVNCVVVVFRGERITYIDVQILEFLFEIYIGRDTAKRYIKLCFTNCGEGWVAKNIHHPLMAKIIGLSNGYCEVNFPPFNKNEKIESMLKEFREDEFDKLMKILQFSDEPFDLKLPKAYRASKSSKHPAKLSRKLKKAMKALQVPIFVPIVATILDELLI